MSDNLVENKSFMDKNSLVELKSLGKSLSVSENSGSVSEKKDYSLFALRDALRKLKDFDLEIENASSISDKPNRMFTIEIINEKKNELRSILDAGVVIKGSPVIDRCVDDIVFFLEENGCDSEKAKETLSLVCFCATDVTYLHGGRLVTVGNKVSVNYDMCEFDNEGKCLGFCKDYEELLSHVLTHELLHVLSIKGQVLSDDSFSEGLTEMFSRMIAKDGKANSSRYDFVEKMCTLITDMVGLDKIFDDYFNNLSKMPSVRKMFEDCSCDRFTEFRGMLDAVIVGCIRDSKTEKKEEEYALGEKLSSLDFFRENVLIPYCVKNKEKAPEILEKFNGLFKEFGVSCSLEDIEEKKNKPKTQG